MRLTCVGLPSLVAGDLHSNHDSWSCGNDYRSFPSGDSEPLDYGTDPRVRIRRPYRDERRQSTGGTASERDVERVGGVEGGCQREFEVKDFIFSLFLFRFGHATE